MNTPPFNNESLNHHLAIIVPFRNRYGHLERLVTALRRFEGLRHIDFSICVVNQANERPFNRGRLINIGYQLSAPAHDYFCFHDVDLVPERVDYSYPRQPTHLAAALSQYEYQRPYPNYFGGVTLFNACDFRLVNGFSNRYWGWGGEDDDLFLRCTQAGLVPVWREGRFTSLAHDGTHRGLGNPDFRANLKRLHQRRKRKTDFRDDGLAQLRCSIVGHRLLNCDSELTVHLFDADFAEEPQSKEREDEFGD